MIRRLLSLLAPVALSTAALAASPSAPVQIYVQAPGPLGPLKGTMLAPASGRLAMMLIIPGSGPTDRDGNNPLGVKAATYRLLAEGLAERGIGTVRIDKRGMFASAAAVADGNAVASMITSPMSALGSASSGRRRACRVSGCSDIAKAALSRLRPRRSSRTFADLSSYRPPVGRSARCYGRSCAPIRRTLRFFLRRWRQSNRSKPASALT
jgi:hypothetical protein